MDDILDLSKLFEGSEEDSNRENAKNILLHQLNLAESSAEEALRLLQEDKEDNNLEIKAQIHFNGSIPGRASLHIGSVFFALYPPILALNKIPDFSKTPSIIDGNDFIFI